MSDEVSLKNRVLLYNLMQLPGQPQMMHIGSSNLVNDLAAEVTRLTRQVGEATGRIETDGKLIAELEAEIARLKGLDNSRTVEAREITSEFVCLQAAEIARLTAALAEAEAKIFSRDVTIKSQDEASDRREQQAREAGHEEVLSFLRNGRWLTDDAPAARFAREVELGWQNWGKLQAEKRRT